MNAIFFDLDGTLLHLEVEYREVLAGAFREVTGELREGWLDTYDTQFFERLDTFDPEPYRRAFEACSGDLDVAALKSALRRRELEALEPPANVREDLERLSQTNRLGVLTNGVGEWQRRKLDAFDLSRYFDGVVVSYEVGAHKPDGAIFRAAEKQVPADRYAMIGDSTTDVEGGKRAGWATHQYSGGGFDDISETLEW